MEKSIYAYQAKTIFEENHPLSASPDVYDDMFCIMKPPPTSDLIKVQLT
jgi:hypothetical protein